jgi:putative oxidoreductase
MRFLTGLRWLAAVDTTQSQWVVPSRLAVGALLLFPMDGKIQQLFTFHNVDQSALSLGVGAGGMALRAVEILTGMSFVAGLGIKLAVYPTVAIFAVRALANVANSFAWLRDVLNNVLVPHGDWAFGAVYLGVALFLSDFLAVGSGRWSVDYWLSKKFEVFEKSSGKR